jgi:multidrug efflux pump subunit AcrA (membrane-fusion protein)
VRLEPQFAEGQKNLAAGQSATVMVPVGEAREVLSVHKDAIVQRRSGDIVFVVEDGKANARPVRLGESVGGRFEVLDGLEAGESVVVRGNERLRDGQAVTIDTSGELEPVTERGGDGAASDTSGSHVTPRDPKAS